MKDYINPQSGLPGAHWPGLDRAPNALEKAQLQSAIPLSRAQKAMAPGFQGQAPESAHQLYAGSEGWIFYPVDPETEDLASPMDMPVPGSWPDERTFCAGWYLSQRILPKQNGKRLFIRMETVPLFCVFFVNGLECGRHIGSFTPFEFDITDAVHDGENTLALYVHDETASLDEHAAYNQLGLARRPDHIPCRSGIRCPITFELRNEVFANDVWVKTSTRQRKMDLVCEITNAGQNTASGNLSFKLLQWPDGEEVSLPLPVEIMEIPAGTTKTLTISVPWPNPNLWSPEHPSLYVLQTTFGNAQGADTLSTRFGFREFWCEGRDFMLNGKKTRLLGPSFFCEPCTFEKGWPDLYTPAYLDRDHVREIMKLEKDLLGINSIRVHATIRTGAVYQAGDEAGVMLIDQSSVWTQMGNSYRFGGGTFLRNSRSEFREWVRRDRNCPSVVIWDSENEIIRDDVAKPNKPMSLILDSYIRENDDTRPIEHSGAGWYAPDQQIVHEHMQEHYTKIIDEWRKRWNTPLLVGEFWVGGRGEWRLPTSPELRNKLDAVEEEARTAAINALEMRYWDVSGIMPFNLIAMALTKPVDGRKQWEYEPGKGIAYGIPSEFTVNTLRHAYQPVTAFFWPPSDTAVSGAPSGHEIVVCNDSEEQATFTAQWGFAGLSKNSLDVSLAPGGQHRIAITDTVPPHGGTLKAQLLHNGSLIASDSLELHAVDRLLLDAPELNRKVLVYEGQTSGTIEALRALGINATAISEVPETQPEQTLWIIAPNASDVSLNRQEKAIRDFLENGGRILCLNQERWMRWSPIQLKFWSAVLRVPPELAEFDWPEGSKDLVYSRYAPIYAPGHPVFKGIKTKDLRWWDDFDGRLGDDALTRPAYVGNVAKGAWRVLAGAERWENASLLEARVGKGMIMFCQAHLLQPASNPQPRLLLMNILKYLDGEGWTTGEDRVRVEGIDIQAVAKTTGLPQQALTSAKPQNGAVLLAGDGVSINAITDWAEAGGTAVVLSAETAARLPGYSLIAEDESTSYAASRGEAHPLFWGVGMANFHDPKQSCIHGALQEYPTNATVLLNGLKMTGSQGRDARDAVANAPVAVRQAVGKGEIIVTTLEPWRSSHPQAQDLWMTLLANAGAPIEPAGLASARVRALATVPLKIDGNLDDWTNDMEDRNVNPYVHAEPVVISSQDAIQGEVKSDADLSAILYFLHETHSLNIAGVVWGKADADEVDVEIRLGSHVLTVHNPGEQVNVNLSNHQDGAIEAAGGVIQDSETLPDARALSFLYNNPVLGTLRPVKVEGRTFETQIPWRALQLSAVPQELPVLVRVRRRAVILQAPLAAKEEAKDTWLNVQVSTTKTVSD